MIDRQAFDQFAQLDEKAGGPVDVNNRGDDILIVVPFVTVLVVGVEHLVDDVGVLGRHGLAYLGAGILGTDQTADLDQPVEGDAVPLPHILGLCFDRLQLFSGVVDQGGQLIPLGLGDGGGKQIVHLFPHHAGGGIQNVKEGFIFPVHVGNKMLGALWKIADGLQIDDLGAGRLYIGVLPGQHLEIMEVFRAVRLCRLHRIPTFPILGLLSHDVPDLSSRRFKEKGKSGRPLCYTKDRSRDSGPGVCTTSRVGTPYKRHAEQAKTSPNAAQDAKGEGGLRGGCPPFWVSGQNIMPVPF